MLTMPEDQSFVCYQDKERRFSGEIKDGCLSLDYAEFEPGGDEGFTKKYFFSGEETAKIFAGMTLKSFINLCARGTAGLERFLERHKIEYTARDWLDEWIDDLPKEEREALETPEAHYYWDRVDSSLYCLNAGPYEWSVADHKWVWSESAAGILIGEGFAHPIDVSEVQGYIDYLEEKYGKKRGKHNNKELID
ncbi:MAG: hypothetical protein IJM61_02520 [Firmicutes bacterium]|nr:hypothetical protein [Bacillota bacterium]